LTFAGPNNRDLFKSDSKIFSPRIGVAWTPAALGGKTVIRAGVGVFVVPIGITGLTNRASARPRSWWRPTTITSRPPPVYRIRSRGNCAAGRFIAWDRHFSWAECDLFQFGGPQSVFLPLELRRAAPTARSTGARNCLHRKSCGAARGSNLNINTIPRQFLSTSPVRDNSVVNLLSGSVTNPFRGLLPNSTALNGTTVPLSQLLAPFPQFPVGQELSCRAISPVDPTSIV